MKRSGRLARRIPLRRRARLETRTPLVRSVALSPTRQAPAVPPGVRERLAVRSGGRCELDLPGCVKRAVQAHHRITRKMGGRSGAGRRGADRLSNLLHCCLPCHGWVTGRPAESYGAGWSLREGQDPAVAPVLFGLDELVLLRDDGSRAAVSVDDVEELRCITSI